MSVDELLAGTDLLRKVGALEDGGADAFFEQHGIEFDPELVATG